MKKESLILIMELLSSVYVGKVTDPEFETKTNRLLKLKKDVEQELANVDKDNDNTLRKGSL